MPDTRLAGTDALGPLVLPPQVQVIEFISDLHLSPDLPLTTAAFKRYLAHTQAQALFILGDLFEAWVGDEQGQQPFEAEALAALRQCAQSRPVYVMRGNRDFLLGPGFFEASGCRELADPQALQAFGQTVLLSHGDALCLDDVDYQRFRTMVRGEAWQQAFLAKPLADRLAVAAQLRAASRARQAESAGVETYADADPALSAAWLDGAGAKVLVHGHTHRPTDEQRAEGWRRIVLSDWDLDQAHRAEVLRWTPSGWHRLTPEA